MTTFPKKDSLMFSLIVFLWLCAGFYFTPRILALLIGPENIFAKSAIILFALLLNLFWFYGFYHLVIILFSYRKPAPVDFNADKSDGLDAPKVALLCTTCNDFREEAVLSCLNQDYPDFHTFILDDSGDEEYKKRIDAFVCKYKSSVTLMRRRDRTGYKAGNLNHCLNRISGFEYFSVSDADTVLPADYIKKLLPYFNKPEIAFAQSRQALNPAQNSAFAQGLGFQIGLHCDNYLSTKEKYGFVMFYGHSALMRLDVLREIGGFPEVATEDLAYSMLIRERGYYGVYAKEVTSLEDFPSTFRQYRKRNEKWIRGTAECLFKYYPSFLKNKNISRLEKFDVFVSALSLLLSLPFFALLLLVGFILPYYFSHFQFQGPMFRMPLSYDNSLIKFAVNVSGNFFWRWDFFLMLIIMVASPILPVLIRILRRPGEKMRYIVMFTFNFYSMQVVSSLDLIAYLISGRAGFPVTGQEKDAAGNEVSNRRATVFIEVLAAFMFLLISVTTKNIWFLVFAAGTAIGTLILKRGFENRLVRIFAVVPLVILAIIIIFITKTLQ